MRVGRTIRILVELAIYSIGAGVAFKVSGITSRFTDTRKVPEAPDWSDNLKYCKPGDHIFDDSGNTKKKTRTNVPSYEKISVHVEFLKGEIKSLFDNGEVGLLNKALLRAIEADCAVTFTAIISALNHYGDYYGARTEAELLSNGIRFFISNPNLLKTKKVKYALYLIARYLQAGPHDRHKAYELRRIRNEVRSLSDAIKLHSCDATKEMTSFLNKLDHFYFEPFKEALEKLLHSCTFKKLKTDREKLSYIYSLYILHTTNPSKEDTEKITKALKAIPQSYLRRLYDMDQGLYDPRFFYAEIARYDDKTGREIIYRALPPLFDLNRTEELRNLVEDSASGNAEALYSLWTQAEEKMQRLSKVCKTVGEGINYYLPRVDDKVQKPIPSQEKIPISKQIQEKIHTPSFDENEDGYLQGSFEAIDLFDMVRRRHSTAELLAIVNRKLNDPILEKSIKDHRSDVAALLPLYKHLPQVDLIGQRVKVFGKYVSVRSQIGPVSQEVLFAIGEALRSAPPGIVTSLLTKKWNPLTVTVPSHDKDCSKGIRTAFYTSGNRTINYCADFIKNETTPKIIYLGKHEFGHAVDNELGERNYRPETVGDLILNPWITPWVRPGKDEDRSQYPDFYSAWHYRRYLSGWPAQNGPVRCGEKILEHFATCHGAKNIQEDFGSMWAGYWTLPSNKAKENKWITRPDVQKLSPFHFEFFGKLR